jgi:hypothetical protein
MLISGTGHMACFFYYWYIFRKDCLLRGVCVLLGAIVTDYTEENISIRFVEIVFVSYVNIPPFLFLNSMLWIRIPGSGFDLSH